MNVAEWWIYAEEGCSRLACYDKLGHLLGVDETELVDQWVLLSVNNLPERFTTKITNDQASHFYLWHKKLGEMSK